MKYTATQFKSNTKKNRFNSIFVVPLLCLLLCSTTYLWAQDRPNVLIMLTDDQGYGDLGSHGNPYLKTPNIEKIGKEGLEMTHFFSYPNCSATRAAILTGRYPYRTGVTGVTQVDHLMNTSEETLAEILSKNGYRTGIFGKWHLGDNAPMRPTDQGFQEALVHKGGGIGQAAGPAGNTYFDPILEHNNESKKYEGYCDDIFTDAALDFISTKSEKPFFTYLATNLPHFPLEVPDEKAEPYRKLGLHEDNARTYGMIDNIDANVGRVLKRLKDLGIADNTLVIFLSDNGPRHRRTKNDVYPGRWVSNLRGTKTSVYECGIRVPFFVKWPTQLKKGQKSSTMGAVIDILPTILDVCDIKAPKEVKLDGRSLLPLWQGRPIDFNDREFITQMHYGPTVFKYMHFAVRTQKYKLVSPHDDPHHILYQPKDEELKEVLANLELYDVEKDPSERINLAKDHPEIVEDLLARYENWFDEVTEERDAKGIQRIYLGSERQPEVNLSQFDWGGPRVLSKNDLGYWRVKTEAGTYKIRLSLPPSKVDGVAHLKYKDVHLTLPIKKDQKTITFNDVELPEGRGNFHAYLKFERLATGPVFVDVERLDL
ncbi:MULTISPECIES: arylsulfatase [Zobellia]|uniref:Sulfatase, family S1-17 n=1 Tax=Zobellia galactanivorans (strain DSM 12802 / CCUG 47099 / CIP 106680 / NCIMB 13871 / Dsij) TaxID=63186 RepID=G0L7B6_ZOBGA|nr:MULTISPECIES: arylsulfatase [Zobellia]MBU3025324.1 arylsulfatase [Zobellia galactanivorans]OWW23595.1 n-acetylgalactosamine-4-sulfatase [Zobellia sp. OII3]CAZ97290.1 Sulfatase, family S1-17 [Zobellia galactanivorans]